LLAVLGLIGVAAAVVVHEGTELIAVGNGARADRRNGRGEGPPEQELAAQSTIILI